MTNRARICLIDDDIFVRDAMALGLGDAGFDVITAPGAAAGFDIASRESVQAIITDMNMPGTGGAQFIPEARALAERRDHRHLWRASDRRAQHSRRSA